ncbi:COP9 signalosome complex subunit 7-like isoform X5 [Bidens hawaiensis]|uniref:COP9 signalosome complex subunit 7-like isoform X5 n=1 Tax=Bidens hawaiensis TaxID=980011 RepID=UPI00404A8A44
MDIEQKQEEIIQHFVTKASNSNASASSLATVITDATSHPSLFAFSEILSVPNVIELQGTEHSVYLDLLRMFAHGTWSEYMRIASDLPPLTPDQSRKLKQLTVLTLAEANKILPYDVLMQVLDVINVRELEDFLINECMYVGIVRGKLDQLRRCFQVQFAAGRDLRPGQLASMIHTLSSWLSTSDNLLITIQDKIKWADTTNELDKKHKKEAEERMEEAKKTLSLKLYLSMHVTYFVAEVSNSEQADIDFRGHEEMYPEPGGVMDYDEDRIRPKRRRHPLG